MTSSPQADFAPDTEPAWYSWPRALWALWPLCLGQRDPGPTCLPSLSLHGGVSFPQALRPSQEKADQGCWVGLDRTSHGAYVGNFVDGLSDCYFLSSPGENGKLNWIEYGSLDEIYLNFTGLFKSPNFRTSSTIYPLLFMIEKQLALNLLPMIAGVTDHNFKLSCLGDLMKDVL